MELRNDPATTSAYGSELIGGTNGSIIAGLAGGHGGGGEH
jgi:hypothetical protein